MIKKGWFHKHYWTLVPQALLRIGSTNITQNCFHHRYSKSVPQTLLKIGSTNVTQIWFQNVTENWFHKCYLKLVAQMLLKIGSTNITQNWFYWSLHKMHVLSEDLLVWWLYNDILLRKNNKWTLLKRWTLSKSCLHCLSLMTLA